MSRECRRRVSKEIRLGGKGEPDKCDAGYGQTTDDRSLKLFFRWRNLRKVLYLAWLNLIPASPAVCRSVAIRPGFLFDGGHFAVAHFVCRVRVEDFTWRPSQVGSSGWRKPVTADMKRRGPVRG